MIRSAILLKKSHLEKQQLACIVNRYAFIAIKIDVQKFEINLTLVDCQECALPDMFNQSLTSTAFLKFNKEFYYYQEGLIDRNKSSLPIHFY